MSVAVDTTQPHRLIASVAIPTSSLWTVPISNRIQSEADVTRLPIPNARALSPRAASDYLLFLSSRGGGDGLWKLKDNAVAELWKGTEGGVVAAPAVSGDGMRICFSYPTQGRSHLYLMNSDGLNVRLLTDSFDVRSPASWSRDGKWVVVAGNDGQGTYVFKVSVEDGAAIRLIDTVSYNPVWSPNGTNHRLFRTAARVDVPDKGGHARQNTRSTARYPGLLCHGHTIQIRSRWYRTHFRQGRPLHRRYSKFLRDQPAHRQERQMTDLKTSVQMRTFDVMPDGKQIVFDRLRQNSDIAMIDLPR